MNNINHLYIRLACGSYTEEPVLTTQPNLRPPLFSWEKSWWKNSRSLESHWTAIQQKRTLCKKATFLLIHCLTSCITVSQIRLKVSIKKCRLPKPKQSRHKAARIISKPIDSAIAKISYVYIIFQHYNFSFHIVTEGFASDTFRALRNQPLLQALGSCKTLWAHQVD